MKLILFTILGLIVDYLLILVMSSAVTCFVYLFNSSINVMAHIIGLAILAIIFDAFRARITEEYNATKSFFKD